MEAAVLESHGVTSEVFQKSLIAHQHNQLLQQTVMAMQVNIFFIVLLLFCKINLLINIFIRWKINKD